MGEKFLTYLQQAKRWQEDYIEDCKRWQTDLVNAIHQEGGSFREQRTLGSTFTAERENILMKKFLESLQFSDIRDRKDRIAEAYGETFLWIYHGPQAEHRPWASFIDWLESDSNLYWITGKAGSGKSTLMKYIYDDERTSNHLARWSPGNPPLTAAFFFWNSGSKLQMSQNGLLRSLLFQLLSKCPALIQRIFPERWEVYSLFSRDSLPWSQQELQQAFKLLAKDQISGEKYCFFIDGLDEFDGDHSNLIDLLKDVTSSAHIKLCVSSRPWVIFEDAFKNKPSLMLENLTYPDIKLFVNSNFHGSVRFAELEELEPQYARELLKAVVQKSAGVFLWVHLVVRSLLAGLEHADRVSDLQKRLDFLPPDLENLYEKMLSSLDPFYYEHASQYFQLIRAAINPPTLLFLSFADEDPGFVQNCKVQALDNRQKLLRADRARRRLNSRCKGLLEVTPVKPRVQETGFLHASIASTSLVQDNHPELLNSPLYSTIQYLHGTVKDFLESPQVWSRLLAATQHRYDPNLALCRSYLMRLKTMDVERKSFKFWVSEFCHNVGRCLKYAHASQETSEDNRSPEGLIDVLDQLDRVATKLVNTPASNQLTIMQAHKAHRTSASSYSTLEQSWTCALELQGEQVHSFLSLVIRSNFHSYVDHKVENGCLVATAEGIWPLLADAVYAKLGQEFHVGPSWYYAPDMKMIKLLLDHGADPNRSLPDGRSGTVWTQLLESLIKSLNRRALLVDYEMTTYLEILSLFLERGADPTLILLEHVLQHVLPRFLKNAPSDKAKSILAMTKRPWHRRLFKTKKNSRR